MTFLLGFILVLAFLVLLAVWIYNSLVGKRNQILNAEGSIDSMLKKRFDLLPNLVETCKVYLSHEKEMFNYLAELRMQASTGNLDANTKDLINTSASKTVADLMVLAENYPELKSSNNFLQLQAAWNETEDQIAASRRFYNSAIVDYNTAIQVFPSSLVAAVFGFKERNVFEAKTEEKAAVSARQLFS